MKNIKGSLIKSSISNYIHDDKVVRVWIANNYDYPFILEICKKFRDHEFFYVPDSTIKDEIRKGNIIAFDYNVLEAGYIWVTFNKNGKSRVNQLAVDEQLWRNKVGSIVTKIYEKLADNYGMWACYLSCNTNTPGDKFWPTQGWTPIVKKEAGKGRGGFNLIWAKLLPRAKEQLLPVSIYDVKSIESYKFQSSITASILNKKNNDSNDTQRDIFNEKD